MVQWLALLLDIREVAGLNLGLLSVFCAFTQASRYPGRDLNLGLSEYES
jgi:hypothetical protein